MQKTILLFLISFVVLSCGNQTQKEGSTQTSKQKTTASDDQSKTGRSIYAVIWTTPNAQNISEYAETISTEFTELWKQDIIENAYFDKESGDMELDQYPNIAFFLKAKSKKEAISILNGLTLVKEGIASYKIFPVGTLWLGRNTDAVNKKGTSNVFVAVWTTQSLKPENKLVKAQSDDILALWNDGTIENVYFDIEGVMESNEKTDFVLYVNANSIGDAESICKELPYFKEGIATYNIYPVGVFWYGTYGVE